MARFIEPSADFKFYKLDGMSITESIEDAARTCYKSKDKITEGSADKLVRSLLRRGHHAMLEFGYARGHFVCNRGVSHELVRHRLFSFAQESTRYVDYAAQDGGIQFIIPPELDPDRGGMTGVMTIWKEGMEDAERRYNLLRERGVPAQIARGVLTIDVKTEVVFSGNLREWAHAFSLRCDTPAHPHIRRLMSIGLRAFAAEIPAMFDGQAERLLG